MIFPLLLLFSFTSAAKILGDTNKATDILDAYHEYTKCSETIKSFKYRGEFQPMSTNRAKNYRIKIEKCFYKAKELDSLLNSFFSQTGDSSLKGIAELKKTLNSTTFALSTENRMDVPLSAIKSDLERLNKFIASKGDLNILREGTSSQLISSHPAITIVKPQKKTQDRIQHVKSSVSLEVLPKSYLNEKRAPLKVQKVKGSSHHKDEKMKKLGGNQPGKHL